MPHRRTRSAKESGNAEDLTSRVNRLSAHFQSEMESFRNQLTTVRADVAEPGDVATVDELLRRFGQFQLDFDNEIKLLREKVCCLAKSLDHNERQADGYFQHMLQNKLLLYGVQESSEESSAALMDKVVDLINDRMRKKNVEISCEDVSNCYRFGRKHSDKPRPIHVSFVRVFKRNLVFGNKSAFKGSKILLAEFLTSKRHAVYKAAKSRFKKECWTNGGNIYALINGAKRLIRDISDLD